MIYGNNEESQFIQCGLWCLMPLSTIFQLYCGIKDLLVEETGVPGENQQMTNLPQSEKTLSHNVVSSTVHLATSEIRTHNFKW